MDAIPLDFGRRPGDPEVPAIRRSFINPSSTNGSTTFGWNGALHLRDRPARADPGPSRTAIAATELAREIDQVRQPWDVHIVRGTTYVQTEITLSGPLGWITDLEDGPRTQAPHLWTDIEFRVQSIARAAWAAWYAVDLYRDRELARGLLWLMAGGHTWVGAQQRISDFFF